MSNVDYETACTIKNIYLKVLAELTTYNWSNDFKVSEVDNLVDRIKSYNWFKEINPNKLTKNNIISLGGMEFSENSDLVLLPLWMLPFITETFAGADINNGDIRTINKKNVDNDNRFGCLAYGVIPK